MRSIFKQEFVLTINYTIYLSLVLISLFETVLFSKIFLVLMNIESNNILDIVNYQAVARYEKMCNRILERDVT